MNKQKGITLIVLVITIIIMLIIAGVSINSLTGQEGTISEAKQAKIDAEEMALLEEIRIIVKGVASRNLEETAEIEEKVQQQLNLIDSTNHEYKPTIKIKDEQYIDDEGNKAYKKDGYTLLFGVYSIKVMYLDKDLKEIKIADAVIGDPNEWYIAGEEGNSFAGVKTAILTKYTGPTGDIVIPQFVNGYLIVGIGKDLFSSNQSITSVTFNEGLIEIQENAFVNCDNLISVSELPSTLKSIGASAFEGCENLIGKVQDSEGEGSVLIKSGISYVSNVFKNCPKITGDIEIAMKILLPNATVIPAKIFDGMNGLYGTIIINSNVTTIQNNAFSGCTKVEGIILEESSSLQTIGESAFYQCGKESSKFDTGILDFQEGLVSIGTNAFSECYIVKSVTLPASLESVGNNCFDTCGNLESIFFNCGDVFTTEYMYFRERIV